MLIPVFYGSSPFLMVYPFDQWEFQDPKMEVPTIYTAYFLGLCKGISPQNMANNMVLTYLHFRILEISHWFDGCSIQQNPAHPAKTRRLCSITLRTGIDHHALKAGDFHQRTLEIYWTCPWVYEKNMGNNGCIYDIIVCPQP